MARRTGPTPRPGYTMIELLVVILIISVLAALTTAAVVKVLGSGKKASAAAEIGNLDLALTNFHKDHKFYPPSYMTEAPNPPDGKTYVRQFRIPNNVNQPEFFVLKKMFPRWTPASDPSTGAIATTDLPTGAGQPLDANQVMVYFLGGPRALFGSQTLPSATFGWEKTRPFAPAVGANTRIDPYYDFPEVRLMPEGGAPDGRFRDPWGTPYAYFSSNGNNYEPRFIFPWFSNPSENKSFLSWGSNIPIAPNDYPPTTLPANYTGVQGSFQDPTEPTHLVHPYVSNGRPVNEGKVQIISAGPNLGFGRGLVWTPGTNEYVSAGGGTAGATVGNDDIANFNAGAALGETGR